MLHVTAAMLAVHVTAAMLAVHSCAAMLAENSFVHAIGVVFHPILIAVGTMFAALYALVPNYGFAIILLTVLVMALLTPLTIKSTRSMMAMQRLQPEITRLRQKYKGPDNRERLNHELMRVYEAHGISPVGSCLPAFLQMPFLIVLYDVIRGLTATVRTTVDGHSVIVAQPRYIPASSQMAHHLVANHGAMNWFGIDLARQPFSTHAHWFGCLPYLGLVIVAVGLQYIQMVQMARMTRIGSRNPTAGSSPTPIPAIQWLTPLLFIVVYLFAPAAVVLYMIVSSAIRIGTQEGLFRTGLVSPPPSAEARPGAT
jgi:YidC/Oxa1 family membrane protein insertase